MQQPKIDRWIREELLSVIVAKDVAIMADWNAPRRMDDIKAYFELLQKCISQHIKNDSDFDENFHPYVYKLAGKILHGENVFKEPTINKCLSKAFGLAEGIAPKTFKLDSSPLDGADVLA